MKVHQILIELTVDHSLDRPMIYASSPHIPGLLVGGGCLADTMSAAGEVAARLIELNKMEEFRPLLLGHK